MTSVELKDAEDVARRYCGDNLSRFLRELILQYDKEQTKKKYLFTTQTLAYLLISICFLIIGVSFYSNIVAVLVPSVTILCGVFLFIYCFILVKKQKIIIGGT
jgi:hypothetical protein